MKGSRGRATGRKAFRMRKLGQSGSARSSGDPCHTEAAGLSFATFESAPLGMACSSIGGRLSVVNAEFARILGYGKERLNGAQLLSLVYPDDVERIRTILQELLSEIQATSRTELRLLHGDGRDVWVEAAISVQRDRDRNPSRFVISVSEIEERKLREDMLQKTESWTRTALENLPLIFYVIDAAGKFQLSIGAGLKGLGLQHNQVVGQSAFDIYRDFPAITESLLRALRGETVTYESNVGGVSHLNICVPLCGIRGEIAGTVGVALDISERKRAERALRIRDEEYRTLVRGLPDVVLRFDTAGRHLFASENVSSVTGISAEQCIGKTHRELGLSETLCRTWESGIAAVVAEKAQQEMEVEFEFRERRYTFNRRLIPQFDELGNVTSILSIGRDVTRQRRTEGEYRLLFRQMLDGVAVHEIICDEQRQPIDYRFLAVNPAFERLTGLLSGEVVGKTARAVLPSIEPFWIQRYGKVALTGAPTFFEYASADLGKHFRVTAFCPAPGQFVCIFSDITEHIRAEAVRAKLEAQLRQAQKLESVGRLAGGIAHDFNNMLGVILGSVELAIAQTDPKSGLYSDLTEIRQAAERSAELTRQLLTFSRQQPIAPRAIEPSEVIESMLKMLRRLIGENIMLRWQPGADVWQVRMDPTQFHQIIVNLCANSRDAIADVGSVTIDAANCVVTPEHAAPHVKAVAGEYVCIVISDDGAGIPKDILEHVFEPFFTTKRVGEGTGLGLAMVYGAVTQNGGFIEASSEVGKGTSFSIFLPRYCSEEPRPTHESTMAPPASSKATILVMEDEPSMLEVMVRHLERADYRIIAACKPREAIRAATAHSGPIELLITDMVMPEMNGRELAKRILEIHPGMKVLYMSGYAANIIAAQGMTEPELDFIDKPFKHKDLIKKIRTMLLDASTEPAIPR